jgi:hypothetical protein
VSADLSSAESPGRPSYNPVFEKLVGDTKNLEIVRLVAYGLYKIAKREWTQKIWQEKHRKPTEEELAGYADTWTEQQLLDKVTAAQSALVVYGESVVDDARPNILAEALRGSGWKAFWISLAAAAAYTLALLAIALILKASGVDVIGVIDKIGRP